MEEPIARVSIRLNGVWPPIWRLIDVPLAITLKGLHDTIQACFGWQDEHLYMFTADGKEYGEPDPDYEPDLQPINASGKRLRSLVDAGCRRLRYLYDFGDRWDHDVIIEELATGTAETRYPHYVDGGGRTPPENVGGTEGYARFLERIENPNDQEHANTVAWLATVGHEGRWLWNQTDDALTHMRVEAIARRRRPRARSATPPGEVGTTARGTRKPAGDPATLRDRLSDQGWLDDSSPEEETGAIIDAADATTGNDGIGPEAIGRLAAFGIEIMRWDDGRALLAHTGPCGLGTQIIRETDGRGRLDILTGMTETNEQWVEDPTARSRLVDTMEGIAREPAWSAANPDHLGLTELQRGAQQVAEVQWALARALEEWRAAPMAASTIERLVSRLQAAKAELHVQMDGRGGPTRLHISGNESRRPSEIGTGLFVLGGHGDEVMASTVGPRIKMEIIWKRDGGDGQLILSPAAAACATLEREQSEGSTGDRGWRRDEWRARILQREGDARAGALVVQLRGEEQGAAEAAARRGSALPRAAARSDGRGRAGRRWPAA